MKKVLFISCFGWYKTRIKPIRDMLVKQGYQAITLIADFNHITKERIEEKKKECTYIEVPMYRRNISIKRIYSHFMFGKEVNKYILKIQPDLIYVQVPPNNVAKYCTQYKLRNKESILYLDIIDLWPESMPFKHTDTFLPLNIWKKWRSDCVVAADHIFTECDLYKNMLSDLVDLNKISTLHLFRERTNNELRIINNIISNISVESKHIRLAYLGSINNIIDIDGICAVLKWFLNRGFYTEIHIIGIGESLNEFKKRVEETGVNSHFYGAVFDADKIAEILAPCDFGLNLMKDSTKIGLTTKSVHYFSLGLPVINNIKGDTWEIVDDYGIGINIDSNQVNRPNLSRHINKHDVLKCFDEMFSYEAFQKNISKIICG